MLRLHHYIIEGEVAWGPHAGKKLFIPRIQIVPSDKIFPIHIKRKQFPVRLAFAITANKSQGYTLKKVGIHIRQTFFSHGQLYVAMSRVGLKENVKLFTGGGTDDAYTDNVVYREVLHM